MGNLKMNHEAIALKSKKKEFEASAEKIHGNFQHVLGETKTIESDRVAIARNEGLHGEWRIVQAKDLEDYIKALGLINSEVAKYDWPDEIGRPQNIVGRCQQLIVHGAFCYIDEHPLPKMDFRFCEFRGDVEFAGVEFENKANFGYVAFHNDVSFGGAKFKDDAIFTSIRTRRPASFSGVIFSGNSRTLFIDANFLGYTRFNGTIFTNGADFSNTMFAHHTEFIGAEFNKRAIFSSAKFEGPLTFKKTTFFGAPQFHGVNFFEGTTFVDCKFSPGKWLGYWQEVDRVGFRTLKLKMAALRAQREEAMFFSLELAIERVVAHWEQDKKWPTSPAKWLISGFYAMGSQYGQSPGRAVCIFFGWNMIFMTLYSTWCYIAEVLGLSPIIQSASRTSFLSGHPWLALGLQNALNPLALLSEKPLATTTSGWVFILSLIQSVGSLSILALLFLAIRGNFQKGSSSSS